MPLHDWSKVDAGDSHDFNMAWIGALRSALNASVLPDRYYAQAERRSSDIEADGLTLEHEGSGSDRDATDTAVAVAVMPPQVAVTDRVTEATAYLHLQRRIAIRDTRGDRIVALIELVSPGNKTSQQRLGEFIDKAVAALHERVHLLILDVLPPGPGDPDGMHAAVWGRLGKPFSPPPGQTRTLAAYAAESAYDVTAYVEPLGLGDALPPMPLFLDPGHYVNAPLAETYQQAFDGMPRHLKAVLEA